MPGHRCREDPIIKRTALRRLGVVPLPIAALLLAAAPAGAHVTVSSPDASAGGYGKLVFRVPAESETASTTELSVTLPTDLPFTGVRTKDLPGWTAEVSVKDLPEPAELGGLTLTEAPRTVTWTAEPGEGIGPGEFAEFELSVGPFVDDPSATYVFAAEQTYDDGEVVTWDDTGDDAAEPAPVLGLDASAAGGHGGSATQTAADEETAADTAAGTDTSAGAASDPTARLLGGAGLLLGGVAVGIALSGRRGRRVVG